MQVNAGALQLFAGGTHQGDFGVNGVSTVLRMASGENQLDGSTITGTGAVELIGGNLRVANGGAIIESRLRLQTNSVVTGPGQLEVSAVTWTDGTMSDTGKTLVVPGGVMTISGNSTKNIEKRTLENQGTLTWADSGTILAIDGARLINFGTMTITGSGTFDGAPTSANTGQFINQGTLIVEAEAAPAAEDIRLAASGAPTVINSVFINASGASLIGAWSVLAGLLRLIGIDMVASGGGNIVAGGGGNIVAGGGGHLIGNDGGTLIADDGGTLIGHNGSAIAGGGKAPTLGDKIFVAAAPPSGGIIAAPSTICST